MYQKLLLVFLISLAMAGNSVFTSPRFNVVVPGAVSSSSYSLYDVKSAIDKGLRNQYWYYLSGASCVYDTTFERQGWYSIVNVYRNYIGTFFVITNWDKSYQRASVQKFVRLGDGIQATTGTRFDPITIKPYLLASSFADGQYQVVKGKDGNYGVSGNYYLPSSWPFYPENARIQVAARPALQAVTLAQPAIQTVAVAKPVVETIAVAQPTIQTVAVAQPVVQTIAVAQPSVVARPSNLVSLSVRPKVQTQTKTTTTTTTTTTKTVTTVQVQLDVANKCDLGNKLNLKNYWYYLDNSTKSSFDYLITTHRYYCQYTYRTADSTYLAINYYNLADRTVEINTFVRLGDNRAQRSSLDFYLTPAYLRLADCDI